MPIPPAPQATLAGQQPVGTSVLEARPFLRFYHSDALRTKTLAVLTALEQAPDRTKHRNTLTDMVMELTDAGLNYYFLRALDLAKAGFVVEQSAKLGMAGVSRVLGPVVRNVIGRMDKDQLLIVCKHIRQLME